MRLGRVLTGIFAGPLLGVVLAGTGARAFAAGPRSFRVQRGVLTVDGLTVAKGLDFKIANLRYLYVALPGSGTAVIAERPFAGALEQRAAFRGNTLTVSAGGSRLQLTASNRMRGTRSAYVRFERGAGASIRFPAVNYGESAVPPAIWPEDAGDARKPGRRALRVKVGRALKTARLCAPSAHGPERCATVREVVYNR